MTSGDDWIEREAARRWALGVRTYRERPDAPFVGDPLSELVDELVDSLNYLREAARREGYGDDASTWSYVWALPYHRIRELLLWTRSRQDERRARPPRRSIPRHVLQR